MKGLGVPGTFGRNWQNIKAKSYRARLPDHVRIIKPAGAFKVSFCDFESLLLVFLYVAGLEGLAAWQRVTVAGN